MGRNDGGRGTLRAAAGAIGDELDQARDREAAKQLSMLAPTRFVGKRAAEKQRKIANEVLRARGAGRPKGAKNIATRQIIEFLRAHGYDPVVQRWRWLLHTPETLASELGCTKLEAFDRLDKIHGDLRRLFYPDAVALDDQGKPVPQLVMNIGTQNVALVATPQGTFPAQRPPWETDAEVQAGLAKREQNQPVTIEAEAKSHGAKSHGEGK